jgi:hypothetical protein
VINHLCHFVFLEAALFGWLLSYSLLYHFERSFARGFNEEYWSPIASGPARKFFRWDGNTVLQVISIILFIIAGLFYRPLGSVWKTTLFYVSLLAVNYVYLPRLVLYAKKVQATLANKPKGK